MATENERTRETPSRTPPTPAPAAPAPRTPSSSPPTEEEASRAARVSPSSHKTEATPPQNPDEPAQSASTDGESSSLKKKKKKKPPPDEREPAEMTPVEACGRELVARVDEAEREVQALYRNLAVSAHPEDYREEIEVKKSSYKRAAGDLAKASARMAVLRDELTARWREVRGSKKRHRHLAPPNTVIDYEEELHGYFASGLNPYKLLLLCFVGSFIGVVIESIWCVIRFGRLESRAGLVYGPFNLLYGLGAVLLTVCLYRFRNRGRWLSFLGGMIVGSVLEYVCSWAQEMAFGSRSWDYSNRPFNINGRICLLYSVYWGVLGLLWVKVIYPWLARLFLKIPNKVGKVVVYALLAFFVFDAVVTVLAIYRWTGRMNGVPAANAFFAFIDRRFPDARMRRIFANMQF